MKHIVCSTVLLLASFAALSASTDDLSWMRGANCLVHLVNITRSDANMESERPTADKKIDFISPAKELPKKTVMVGDPAMPAQLPAALQGAYAAGARDITIAPGIYVLPATAQKSIELISWKDTRIQARGVTIVFENLAHRPVCLRECENVALEGAVLRFATPAFTQGRIVEKSRDDRGDYLDWQIDAGYPVNVTPEKATFDVADQKTRLIKIGTGDVGFGTCEAHGGAGRFRLRQCHGLLGPAMAGDWLFTRIQACGSVVQIDRSNRCTMRNVTLQNAGFAAFFETKGGGGHTYFGCKVVPGPRPVGANEDQLVGCGADGFHSVGTRTGPTIERCAWEGLLHDDCIAIHGCFQQVEQVEADKLIMAKGNRGGFVVGEPVRISSTNGFFGEFTCTSMRTLGDGRMELTLDRPSGAPTASKASNPRCNGAGYKIINCTLGNCRSRGILVKADHGLIEGNTISGCGMSAISIGPEYYWGEADYARQVTVKGNKLVQNVLNGSAAGTILIHGDGAIGNADITIAGNVFDRNYGQTAIRAAFSNGMRIANNRFIESPLPLPGGKRTILQIETSRDITLQGNTVEGASERDTLVTIGRNVEAVIGNNDSGIRAVTGK